MPELPEVEAMAERIAAAIAPATYGAPVGVKSIAVLRQNGKYGVDGQEKFSKITSVTRRGKYLVFRVDTMGLLICHNAMSGYWDTAEEPWTFDYVEGKREATEKDVRVKIELNNGKTLRFHDARLFGSLKILRSTKLSITRHDIINGLCGPEAVNTNFIETGVPLWTDIDLFHSCKNSRRAIKQILMDQDEVAGFGNIYAAEALYSAGINPSRNGCSLSTDEIDRLYEQGVAVLRAAIDRRLDYSGLMVYRREKCQRCEKKIEKIEIAKRSSYFCPACQK